MVANPVFLWTTFATYLSWTIYPTLTGSKTPPQNAAKAKKLGGDQLPIKVRLVQLIISGDEENPTD